VNAMSQPVTGRIMNYRIGIRTQMGKWCIIQITGENSVSKAGQLIGRKVVLNFEKNEFIGKIVSLHGRKGVVTAKFRKGIPGKAVGKIVQIPS
jgi:large subunit ribosomal protein L35Ae